MNIIKANLAWRRPLTPKPLTDYDAIAIHHPAAVTASPQDIHAWHLERDNNTWKGFAYGFYVRKDGTVYEGRGFAEGGGVLNHNGHVLSICCEGNYDTQDRVMPDAQFNAAVELLQWIIPQLPNLQRVVGHKFYGGTTCPGQYFPLDKMIAAATGKSKKEDEPVVYEKGMQDKERVKTFQLQLKALGYYGGVIDGDWGAGTDEACAKMQADLYGCPITDPKVDRWFLEGGRTHLGLLNKVTQKAAGTDADDKLKELISKIEEDLKEAKE